MCIARKDAACFVLIQRRLRGTEESELTRFTVGRERRCGGCTKMDVDHKEFEHLNRELDGAHVLE